MEVRLANRPEATSKNTLFDPVNNPLVLTLTKLDSIKRSGRALKINDAHYHGDIVISIKFRQTLSTEDHHES